MILNNESLQHPQQAPLLSQPNDEGLTACDNRVRELELSQLTPLKGQPRRLFEEGPLTDLANSIRNYGILQPLIVSHNGGGLFTIIAGERRWRAAHLAGLSHVPCLVRNPNEHTALEIALIENIQREELSPVEEARTLERLLNEHNYTQETLASKIGKERSTVANALRLLSLPEEVLSDLDARTLSAGHARALCGLDDKRAQIRTREIILKKKLSVRQTEDLVKKYKRNSNKPQPMNGSIPQDLRNLCDQFKGHLGTKVRISGSPEKGKIEISYFTQDDLERIAELVLGGGLDGALRS
jgi:ParB family chromosome partitioning protein